MFRRPSLKSSTPASQVNTKTVCHTTDSIPDGTDAKRSSTAPDLSYTMRLSVTRIGSDNNLKPKTAIYNIYPDQSFITDLGTFHRAKDTFNWTFTSDPQTQARARANTSVQEYTLKGKAADTPTSIALRGDPKVSMHVWKETSLGDHINFEPSVITQPDDIARQGREHEGEGEGGIYAGLRGLFSPKLKPAETFDSL